MMKIWSTLAWAVVLAVLFGGVLVPTEARAFCGFYVSGADAPLFNNATQVVLMRDGTMTVLSMQNNYQGPPEDFAMVVPVPVVLQKENVRTLPKDVFDRVDKLTAPRLVEYWEQDPCPRRGGYPYGEMAMASTVAAAAPMEKEKAVRVEAQFEVGEYEVVVLSATEGAALDGWLKEHEYKIPQGAAPFLQPYVSDGWKFFVAKVDAKKVRFEKGQAMLSPLRFHYESDAFKLPVRLGLLNSAGTQDLIVEVIARNQRYEVANYPNVTIPTNVEVSDDTRKSFGAFYAALFDATLEKNPSAVVTEYAWSASSCDPCPTPSGGGLDNTDLTLLGADVLPSVIKAGDQPPAPPVQGRGVTIPPGMPYDFVVTRVHARYTKAALGEDLVFKKAAPIEGGREYGTMHGKQTAQPLPEGQPSQFQGRYIIRHPWTGAVTCEKPAFGMWGGPPGRGSEWGGAPPPVPAQNLAFAPREGVSLASFVAGTVNALGITGGAPDAATFPHKSPENTGGLLWLALIPPLLVLFYIWAASRAEHRARAKKAPLPGPPPAGAG